MYWLLCASARCPTDPNRAHHLPTSVCPTSLAPCPSPLRHRPLTANFTKSFEPTPASVLTFHALQGFVQRNNRIFEVLLPQLLPSLISSQNVVFAHRVMEIFLPVFGCHHGPKGFRSLTLTVFLPLLPYSYLCNALPPIPSQIAWHKACQSASTNRGPHLLSSIWSMLMHAFSVLTSSARNVQSSAPSLMATSG